MHLGIIKITYSRTAIHFMDDSFVKLGEEVILTLLWQSGDSKSATVCVVISLIFAIDCSNTEFCTSCVCVCARARERKLQHSIVCVCVCVCSHVW